MKVEVRLKGVVLQSKNTKWLHLAPQDFVVEVELDVDKIARGMAVSAAHTQTGKSVQRDGELKAVVVNRWLSAPEDLPAIVSGTTAWLLRRWYEDAKPGTPWAIAIAAELASRGEPLTAEGGK